MKIIIIISCDLFFSKVDDIFQAESNIKPNAKATEIKATRQHLTLEEKQRLAKAKEQEFRMKQQGQIKPILVAQTNSNSKVRVFFSVRFFFDNV